MCSTWRRGIFVMCIRKEKHLETYSYMLCEAMQSSPSDRHNLHWFLVLIYPTYCLPQGCLFLTIHNHYMHHSMWLQPTYLQQSGHWFQSWLCSIHPLFQIHQNCSEAPGPDSGHVKLASSAVGNQILCNNMTEPCFQIYWTHLDIPLYLERKITIGPLSVGILLVCSISSSAYYSSRSAFFCNQRWAIVVMNILMLIYWQITWSGNVLQDIQCYTYLWGGH